MAGEVGYFSTAPVIVFLVDSVNFAGLINICPVGYVRMFGIAASLTETKEM